MTRLALLAAALLLSLSVLGQPAKPPALSVKPLAEKKEIGRASCRGRV